MKALDEIAADGLYVTSKVAALEGVSCRSIHDWMRQGKFPLPDIPAIAHGEPNKWLGRTILAAREARIQRAKDAMATRAERLRRMANGRVKGAAAHPAKRTRVVAA